MAQFRNIKDLKAYLKVSGYEALRDSMDLERELATIMSQTIIERLYNSYESSPEEMDKRRGTSDFGLADQRNMIISDILIEGSGIRVIFENIAEGRDSMRDGMLVDAFENPNGSGHWDKQGVWSNGRSFIEETKNAIRQNPQGVINAIKGELKSFGFKVK